MEKPDGQKIRLFFQNSMENFPANRILSETGRPAGEVPVTINLMFL